MVIHAAGSGAREGMPFTPIVTNSDENLNFCVNFDSVYFDKSSPIRDLLLHASKVQDGFFRTKFWEDKDVKQVRKLLLAHIPARRHLRTGKI